jgi:murein DD-endopeptidase MepM/ murein hydrolase activator NlpD
MIKPGFFAFPCHEPTLARDLIRDTQPSLVKVWASVTSEPQLRDWRALSPSTIFLLVDGDIGDSSTKHQLDNIPQLVTDHSAQWARWRDNGYGSLWMTYNEPPIHYGHDYRARLVEYTAKALEAAHGYGLNLCIFNFSVSWPWASIDAENWWPEFAPAVTAMKPGDYLGLHEYWGSRGPTDLGALPWLVGKHKLCPYNVPMLISECGIDLAVEGKEHQGWAGAMEPGAYYQQLRQYHAMLDKRVKGTAIFLMDYEGREWETFDIRRLARDGLFKGEWDMADPMPVPGRVRLPFDGTPRVTQWYGENPDYYRQFGVAGHNGIDFGIVVGTPLRSVAPGKVTRVRQDSTGYGWHVYVNHGWGQSIYAHMSRIDVQEQQDVQAAQVLGLSGNTGNSTGPHLHFGMRIYGRNVPAMNDWVNPAAILGLSSDPTPPTPEPEDDMDEATKTAIRNTLWNQMGVPYNPATALAQFAKAKGLGAPKDGEQRLVMNGKAYIVQPFDGAIAAVPEGEWSAVEAIAWN